MYTLPKKKKKRKRKEEEKKHQKKKYMKTRAQSPMEQMLLFEITKKLLNMPLIQ